MEKLNDKSLPSSSSDMNQTLSKDNNSDGDLDENKIQLKSLMDKLYTTTDEFKTVIYATKNVRGFSIRPLTSLGYEKFDAFKDSVYDVIKWYEHSNSQLKTSIGDLVQQLTLFKAWADKKSDMQQQKMDEMHNIIMEQKDTIDKLEQAVADNENQVDDIILDLKLNSQETSNLSQEENEELSIVSAENAELKQRIVFLEGLLKRKSSHLSNSDLENFSMKAVAESVEQPEVATEDLHQIVNEIAELEKVNSDIRTNVTVAGNQDANDNFVELKDVIVGEEIDYQKLNGKIVKVRKLVSNVENGLWKAYYEDNGEERMVQLPLNNNSIKLYLTGELIIDKVDFDEGFNQSIHSCTLTSLSLANCSVTFSEFVTLVGSKTIEYLNLNVVHVGDDKDEPLPLEKMLEYFPNLKEFAWCCRNAEFCSFNCQDDTPKNLLKLPIFMNLKKLEMFVCPFEFDLESFGSFMRYHPWVTFKISISSSSWDRFGGTKASADIGNKLLDDRDEILRLWPEDDAPLPEITFDYNY